MKKQPFKPEVNKPERERGQYLQHTEREKE
jgi:hypothetical protein